LLVARALTGLGAGTISTCAVAYAGDWFDYSVRGRAVGLISSAYFAAPILGVPAAAQLADRFGWRSAFLGFALLAALTSAVTLSLPKTSTEHGSSEYGFGKTARAFREFLTRRDTAAALVIAFLVSAGLVGFITYIGEWLHGRFGLATRTIGWVFMFSGLVAVLGAPLGGWLSDHYGKRAVSIGSNVLMAGAILLLPIVSWGPLLLVIFGLTALGAAFRQGPLTALMTELIPGRRRGAFIALRNISSQMGIGLVVLAGGLLYQRHGYFAVTTLAAAMTALVAVLLATHIAEPQPVKEGN
jgi:predicted MFS family arabinose efflux permease